MALQDPQTILAAVLHRLDALEAALRRIDMAGARRNRSEAEARSVAESMQLAPDVFTDGTTYQRKLLAGALRSRGWSYQRIAHVLNCSERTVERYFSPGGKPHRD